MPNPRGPFPLIMEVALTAAASGKIDKNHKSGVSFSWKPGLANGASAACLSYGVRLPPNKPGRTPPLSKSKFGGDEPRSGKTGFAARLTWQADGAADVWANLPGTGERGVSLAAGAFSFPTGRWVLVEQEIRLNTPGEADGILRVWIDGVQKVDNTGVAFRNRDDVRVQGLLSDIHYHGPVPSDTSIKVTNYNFRWQ
jgi:hypothetical protein